MGVEDVMEAERKVALQSEDVVLRRVHDHFLRLIGQQFTQFIQPRQPQRIDQIVEHLPWVRVIGVGEGGNLDQTDLGIVAVEAVALRVQRDQRPRAQQRAHLAQPALGIDQGRIGQL